MAIKGRPQIDPDSLVLKQASLERMLVQAKSLQERGQLKKAQAPAGRSRPATKPLRVKATLA
jgi:hypothetical protein